MKEKEQAHREYKEAISKGHGAYLMDEETPVTFYTCTCICIAYMDGVLHCYVYTRVLYTV